MKLTIEQLQHVLDTYDSGVLSTGGHKAEDGLYCALECISLARNRGKDNFTDNPTVLNMPDVRNLNDGPWSSDVARTQTMLPLLAALSDWSLWSPKRQQQWAKKVSIETVRQVVSRLPHISSCVSLLCKQANTLEGAAGAARAASHRWVLAHSAVVWVRPLSRFRCSCLRRAVSDVMS